MAKIDGKPADVKPDHNPAVSHNPADNHNPADSHNPADNHNPVGSHKPADVKSDHNPIDVNTADIKSPGVNKSETLKSPRCEEAHEEKSK